MEQGRAGCYYDPVEVEFMDILLDDFLARIRAHILVIFRNDYMGKPGGISCD
jgi:hypothetical protein